MTLSNAGVDKSVEERVQWLLIVYEQKQRLYSIVPGSMSVILFRRHLLCHS